MDSNISDIDVQQDIHLFFPSTNTSGKALDTTHSRGYNRSCCQQRRPDLAMDFSMQPDCQRMEQGDPRYLLYQRPIAGNHPRPGAYFHHIRLHACPLPHCPFMEGSDSAAHQSRFMFVDGSRSYVRPYPFWPTFGELS